MRISTFRGRAVGAAGLFIVLAGIVYGIVTSRLPFDSPEARMYRTEADMALFTHAIDIYHADFDAYPAAGVAGLRIAVGYSTNTGLYLPQGLPPDGWGRPFVYISHRDYEDAGSMALKTPEGYFEPHGYQLYSAGADGEAGLEHEGQRRDNIVSWDPARGWRASYEEQQRTYNESRQGPDED